MFAVLFRPPRHFGAEHDGEQGRAPIPDQLRACVPSNFWKCVLSTIDVVIGAEVVENYLADHAGHKGIKAARSQYEAWLDIVSRAYWRDPENIAQEPWRWRV